MIISESALLKAFCCMGLFDVCINNFETIFLVVDCCTLCRSSFAVDGATMTVNGDVERVIKEFHEAKKPIG